MGQKLAYPGCGLWSALIGLRFRNSCAPCWSLSQAFGFLPWRLLGLHFLLPCNRNGCVIGLQHFCLWTSWGAAFLPHIQGFFLPDRYPRVHQTLKEAQDWYFPVHVARWRPSHFCLPSMLAFLLKSLNAQPYLYWASGFGHPLSQSAVHFTPDRPRGSSVSLCTSSAVGTF